MIWPTDSICVTHGNKKCHIQHIIMTAVYIVGSSATNYGVIGEDYSLLKYR